MRDCSAKAQHQTLEAEPMLANGGEQLPYLPGYRFYFRYYVLILSTDFPYWVCTMTLYKWTMFVSANKQLLV